MAKVYEHCAACIGLVPDATLFAPALFTTAVLLALIVAAQTFANFATRAKCFFYESLWDSIFCLDLIRVDEDNDGGLVDEPSDFNGFA